ncbi:uncharacterized protein METZ01_LOCUS177565, partial [marine metagenome]
MRRLVADIPEENVKIPAKLVDAQFE